MIILKDGVEVGRADPPKEPYNLVPYSDPRNHAGVQIVDLYTKDGKHQKTMMLFPDGTIIYEEGPNPNKNVGFLSMNLKDAPWLAASKR